MNLKIAAGFGAGVIVGAVGAVIVLKAWFQKKFDEELSEERRILQNRIHRRAEKASRTRFKAPRSEDSNEGNVDVSGDLRTSSRVIIRDNGYSCEVGEDGSVSECYDKDGNLVDPDDDVALAEAEHREQEFEEIRAKMLGVGQKEISEEDFEINSWGYDKYYFTLYTGDNTFVTDQEEIDQWEDWLDDEWKKTIIIDPNVTCRFFVDLIKQRLIEVDLSPFAFGEFAMGGE